MTMLVYVFTSRLEGLNFRASGPETSVELQSNFVKNQRLEHVLRDGDLCLVGIAPSDAIDVVPCVGRCCRARLSSGGLELGLNRLLLGDVGLSPCRRSRSCGAVSLSGFTRIAKSSSNRLFHTCFSMACVRCPTLRISGPHV